MTEDQEYTGKSTSPLHSPPSNQQNFLSGAINRISDNLETLEHRIAKLEGMV